MDKTNLFRKLQTEWERVGTGTDAQGAVRRWAQTDEILARFSSPVDIVRVCQTRGDPPRSAAVLRAVLGHAGEDPWAARTVLQSVLPGLVRLTRRARPTLGYGGDWQHDADIDQHILALALERIQVLASDPPLWPAQAVIDSTWSRLRVFLRAERNHASRRADLAEVADEPAVDGLDASAELTDVVADAVGRGVLDPLDGWVLVASHLSRESSDDLAALVGRSRRWFFRHRARATRVLCAGGAEALGEVSG